MREIQAPLLFGNVSDHDPIVFLAGSIEMGKAEPWRKRLISKMAEYDVTFLNPRRDDWDSSWEQSIHNPQFLEQVEWELAGLEMSDIIILYFDPKTTSPITLLELGIHANSQKLIVGCPDGYYRKGNVEIVCKKYGITMMHTFDGMMNELIYTLKPVKGDFQDGE
jgi:hypothetical protein